MVKAALTHARAAPSAAAARPQKQLNEQSQREGELETQIEQLTAALVAAQAGVKELQTQQSNAFRTQAYADSQAAAAAAGAFEVRRRRETFCAGCDTSLWMAETLLVNGNGWLAASYLSRCLFFGLRSADQAARLMSLPPAPHPGPRACHPRPLCGLGAVRRRRPPWIRSPAAARPPGAWGHSHPDLVHNTKSNITQAWACAMLPRLSSLGIMMVFATSLRF
jgi:hypothetical protein